MSANSGPIFFAALTAAVAAAGFVINRCAGFVPIRVPALYWYTTLYSLFGGVVMWIAQDVTGLVVFGRITNAYIAALAVGIVIRPVLQLKLFSINVASQQVDVGFAALLAPFEEALLNSIALQVDAEILSFLQVYEHQFQDLDDVKKRIETRLPDHIKDDFRQAFLKKLRVVDSALDAMDLFVRLVGKAHFKRTFRLASAS